MYSNNILNFQESTTILNAHTKKSGNLSYTPHIKGVVVIVVGNGHGDASSNPGRD